MPCLPLRPYKDAQERTKRDMRLEVIETTKATALKFVHNESEHLTELIGDIVQSKGWRQVFGTTCTVKPHVCEKHFAHVLSKEYKLLIGNTKAKSRIALAGETPGDATSSVEAAKMVGRLCHYGDEKR